MKRRQFPLALVALLAACKEAVSPNYEQQEVRLTRWAYIHCGFESPRREFGKVPSTQCPWQWPWEAMKRPDRMPAKGFYNEAEPWVTAWYLDVLREGRVDCAVYQTDTDYNAMQLAA